MAPKIDYSAEPTTLVSFELEDIPGGTRLTLVESGFDELPESRRREAFESNEKGWTMQMDAIQRYVAHAASPVGSIYVTRYGRYTGV